MDRSELLVRQGFIKSDVKGNYSFNKETNQYDPLTGQDLNKGDADEEFTEVLSGYHDKTGYPTPKKSYFLSWEVFDLSLEEPYFWIMDTIKERFPILDKVEDTFAAAENSAFFGVTQQRLGAQQDRVSTYLAQVGKMIKELFQMVRELRILDERLAHYEAALGELEKPLEKRLRSGEITLKGMFVDLVQGGGKSPASVYGMAQQLEFITLPDLFFDAPPFKDRKELENHVKNLEKDFNQNVLRVLLRHLDQFTEWRNRTYQEHKNRRGFMLQYLLQHYHIIQMYITWIKPYLRHSAKLSLKEPRMNSADLVSSFEGSMLDIEVLASKKVADIKVKDKPVEKGYDCLLITFNYRTRPELKVVQEGYQRGPVHIGKMNVTLRVYAWTDEEIKNYKRLKEKETLYLMGDISSSVQQAMESLGGELEHYIEEAKQKAGIKLNKKEEAKKPEKKPLLKSFFGEFYTPSSKDKSRVPDRAKMEAIQAWRQGAGGEARGAAWGVFNNFKKSHRMIAW